HRAWHIPRPIDLRILKRAAKRFVGTHDFAGFAANRGKFSDRTESSGDEREKSFVRTIYSTRIRQEGPCLTIEFDGDGFLYKMVRLSGGSPVKSRLGKDRSENFPGRLGCGQAGAGRFATPREGFLFGSLP